MALLKAGARCAPYILPGSVNRYREVGYAAIAANGKNLATMEIGVFVYKFFGGSR